MEVVTFDPDDLCGDLDSLQTRLVALACPMQTSCGLASIYDLQSLQRTNGEAPSTTGRNINFVGRGHNTIVVGQKQRRLLQDRLSQPGINTPPPTHPKKRPYIEFKQT